MEESVTICAQLAEIPGVCRFVGESADHAGLDARAIHHCQLACDEACTNIIEHGYGRECHDQVIDVTCIREAHQFKIVISDDSAAFDPLNVSAPDPKAQLEEREVGGWGLYFITTLMDDVSYDYYDGRNRLTLIKSVTE